MQLFAQPSFETTLPSHKLSPCPPLPRSTIPAPAHRQLASARVARTKFVYSRRMRNVELKLKQNLQRLKADLPSLSLSPSQSNDSWPLQFSCQLAKSTGNAFIFRIFHINNKVPATVGATELGGRGTPRGLCSQEKRPSAKQAHKRQNGNRRRCFRAQAGGAGRGPIKSATFMT